MSHETPTPAIPESTIDASRDRVDTTAPTLSATMTSAMRSVGSSIPDIRGGRSASPCRRPGPSSENMPRAMTDPRIHTTCRLGAIDAAGRLTSRPHRAARVTTSAMSCAPLTGKSFRPSDHREIRCRCVTPTTPRTTTTAVTSTGTVTPCQSPR